MVGHIEWLIIGGVVVLLFGATALPKLARSLGKAKREFQKGLKEDADGDDPTDAEDTGDEKGSV